MQDVALADLVSEHAAERLLRFRRALLEALPGAVQDVILFGSRARGDCQADSDYDVAVVLTGPAANGGEAERRVGDVLWDSLQGEMDVQAISLSADDFRPEMLGASELVLRIANDGVLIR